MKVKVFFFCNNLWDTHEAGSEIEALELVRNIFLSIDIQRFFVVREGDALFDCDPGFIENELDYLSNECARYLGLTGNN